MHPLLAFLVWTVATGFAIWLAGFITSIGWRFFSYKSQRPSGWVFRVFTLTAGLFLAFGVYGIGSWLLVFGLIGGLCNVRFYFSKWMDEHDYTDYFEKMRRAAELPYHN